MEFKSVYLSVSLAILLAPSLHASQCAITSPLPLPVVISSFGATASTVPVVNAPGTTLAVSGSFAVSSVNITTAAPNAVLPIAGVLIGGVGPTGNFQSFSVTASSAINISGSLTSTPAPLSVVGVNASTSSVGYQAGLSSVPVNVINTPTIANTSFVAVQQSGAYSMVSTYTVVNNVPGFTITVTSGSVTATQQAFAYNTVSTYTAVTNVAGMTVAVASGSLTANQQATAYPVTSTYTVVNNFAGMTVAVASGTMNVIISSASGVSGSTIAVTNAGGVALIVSGTVQPGNTPNLTDWRVTLATNTLSAGTASIGTVQAVIVTTVPYNGTFPTQGQAVGGMGATGAFQAFRTDLSSNIIVTLSEPLVLGATVTFPVPQQVIINEPLILGATVTFNAPQNVIISSASGVSGSTIAVTNAGGVALLIQGPAAEGTASIGNPLQLGVEVASTTMPTAISDGQQIFMSGSNIGQVLVTGIPWGLIQSTYSTTISSISLVSSFNSEAVLVSSPSTGTNYTYLCGCIFNNTTATNGTVFINSPQYGYTVGTAITNQIAIGLPANDVPVGIMAGCENPFFRSSAGANIYIYQNIAASVQNVNMRCNYYVGS